jgi:hypothetical protein
VKLNSPDRECRVGSGARPGPHAPAAPMARPSSVLRVTEWRARHVRLRSLWRFWALGCRSPQGRIERRYSPRATGEVRLCRPAWRGRGVSALTPLLEGRGEREECKGSRDASVESAVLASVVPRSHCSERAAVNLKTVLLYLKYT